MEGNRMKMREALGDVYNILEKIQSFTPRLNDISLMREFRSKICHAKRVIDSAISAPPRNCDVGTAEEHTDRFIDYCCGKCDGSNCKHGLYMEDEVYKCALKWAQTPYEEERKGEVK